MSQGLNPAQHNAVESQARFLRVLAGAGSGKTRVLVSRAAWLIGSQGVSPYRLLAVTFTNKAAAEMRTRIESLCNMNVRGMWVGTFHGLAHRLLRIHWRDAGLLEEFQILDADDQLRMIKRIHKDHNITDTDFTPKLSKWYINSEKDAGRTPAEVGECNDRQAQLLHQVYSTYQKQCEQSSLVDFAELLLRSLKLLQNNPEVSALYRHKFQHILVDEFQDTNSIQYQWLETLLGEATSLTIVGDDDQSIYGWRGAQIQNILGFADSFAGTETVRLEQNYRSTATILAAANAVISQNQNRLGKSLWTEGDAGQPIGLYAAYNEQDEAKYIVDQIKQHKEQGKHYKSQAILYRSNAQSRVLEEALIYGRVPYRIYGGLRFFDRAEIKNTLAYLRLIGLTQDDAAFERVVNFPTRGIGDRTVQIIRERALRDDASLWVAAESLIAQGSSSEGLKGRARNAVAAFIEMIRSFQHKAINYSLSELTSFVIFEAQIDAHYNKEPHEQKQSKLENLKELVSATQSFDHLAQMTPEDKWFDPEMVNEPLFEAHRNQAVSPSPEVQVTVNQSLVAFLEHVALESGERQADAFEDAVQLMTIHSAKGLEFPIVYLSGMEEGLFPSQMSMQDSSKIEEERRLCYVGITRAEEYLLLSHAEVRRIYGEERRTRVSRFVREIPSECIQEVRLGSITRPSTLGNRSLASEAFASSSSGYAHFSNNQAATTSGSQGAVSSDDESYLTLGTNVQHKIFGEGVILALEGKGARQRVQVNFKTAGSKWLMASIAQLETV